MRRLKNGGLKYYAGHPEVAEGLRAIIDECQKFGLFLVPVGELEYWASGLMTGGPNRSKKAGWASEAGRRIRLSSEQASDIVDFVRLIGKFQLAEAQKAATS
jgi:hypothetical protein